MQEIKIMAMSDLHGNMPKIVDYVHVIILAGDISPRINNKMENYTWFLTTFVKWLKTIPADPHIVFVPGNNDMCFEDPEIVYSFKEVLHSMGFNNFHMGSCDILGISFQCSSALRYWGDHPFMLKDKELNKAYSNLTKCDILVTHEAPAVEGRPSFLNPSESDPDYGSPILFEHVKRIKPNFHFFGHVHDAEHVPLFITETTRAACVSLCNEFNQPTYDPLILTICT